VVVALVCSEQTQKRYRANRILTDDDLNSFLRRPPVVARVTMRRFLNDIQKSNNIIDKCIYNIMCSYYISETSSSAARDAGSIRDTLYHNIILYEYRKVGATRTRYDIILEFIVSRYFFYPSVYNIRLLQIDVFKKIVPCMKLVHTFFEIVLEFVLHLYNSTI